jgi:CheY-like chemotaxis protein
MTTMQAGLVLVIDDVEGNRLLAEAYLKRLGWTVRTFVDGTAALAFLQHTLPQAMLIDVRMPGLSGDEMARRLRQDPATAGVRLVGYTAHALQDEIAGFLAAGFDEVLIKPALFADMKRVLPSPATQ